MAVFGVAGVYAVSLLVRAFLLINFGRFQWLFESVFVSTPMSSWKRVEEGMYLRSQGVSPYSGDILHEPPLILLLFEFVTKHCPSLIPVIFLMSDVVTAWSLSCVVKLYLQKQSSEEKLGKEAFGDCEKLKISAGDVIDLPVATAAIYLLSPYSMVCCGAKCSVVLSNLVLSLALHSMMRGFGVGAILALSFATYHTLYPAVLLLPCLLYITRSSRNRWRTALSLFVLVYVCSLGLFVWLSYLAMGNWKFLSATYGCILNVNDLTPNIGLFWYFFTEMFEHFRTFFIFTFQLNTLVYTLPLTICFRRNPLLVIFTLLGLMAIFKSYVSVGDVALYTALLPLWKHLYPFSRHLFLIGCFFLTCSAIAPVLYAMWIFYGSANANFFFGTTLAFNAAQVFLITDVLFGYIKRQFHMKHGLKPMIDGKEAKLCLQ